MNKYGNEKLNPKDTPVQILSPITAALQKHGITLEYTCQKLKESMEAHETKVFQGKDGLVYSEDLIAHGIRLKASVEALKLNQAYPAERVEIRDLTLEDKLRQIREGKAKTP